MIHFVIENIVMDSASKMYETFQDYFFLGLEPSGQSYKASMNVNYGSRVVNISNLQVITNLVVFYERKIFIRLATGSLVVRGGDG